jgi:hypothetical protein
MIEFNVISSRNGSDSVRIKRLRYIKISRDKSIKSFKDNNLPQQYVIAGVLIDRFYLINFCNLFYKLPIRTPRNRTLDTISDLTPRYKYVRGWRSGFRLRRTNLEFSIPDKSSLQKFRRKRLKKI